MCVYKRCHPCVFGDSRAQTLEGYCILILIGGSDMTAGVMSYPKLTMWSKSNPIPGSKDLVNPSGTEARRNILRFCPTPVYNAPKDQLIVRSSGLTLKRNKKGNAANFRQRKKATAILIKQRVMNK